MTILNVIGLFLLLFVASFVLSAVLAGLTNRTKKGDGEMAVKACALFSLLLSLGAYLVML